MPDDRRLIEDYLPIVAIGEAASSEPRSKGHISTLHVWRARRPLTACRAAVYGALVPADQFAPQNGPDNKKQSLGRANAAKFVSGLCTYPSPLPAPIKSVADAQQHILEAHAARLTAETGNRVTIEDKGNRIHLETVGDEKPIGLCGSGLVEALASLVRSGALDRSGNFSRDAARLRITDEDNDPEFVLLASEETQLCRDLALATSDVKNLMRAKAALFSGMQHLVTSIGLTMADIKRIYVAGAFGSHMDIRSAVEIGMLADVEASRHIVVGNSSVKGARLCLLSQEALREATSIAAKMTYLELSVDPTYMDEFMAANFLPHTNLSLFPSVSAQ